MAWQIVQMCYNGYIAHLKGVNTEIAELLAARQGEKLDDDHETQKLCGDLRSQRNGPPPHDHAPQTYATAPELWPHFLFGDGCNNCQRDWIFGRSRSGDGKVSFAYPSAGREIAKGDFHEAL